jgi:hypothetical protein
MRIARSCIDVEAEFDIAESTPKDQVFAVLRIGDNVRHFGTYIYRSLQRQPDAAIIITALIRMTLAILHRVSRGGQFRTRNA